MWDDPEPSDESWEWSGTFDVPDEEFEGEVRTTSLEESYRSGWVTALIWVTILLLVGAVGFAVWTSQFG
jgi:cytoskeletal protein RodZ